MATFLSDCLKLQRWMSGIYDWPLKFNSYGHEIVIQMSGNWVILMMVAAPHSHNCQSVGTAREGYKWCDNLLAYFPIPAPMYLWSALRVTHASSPDNSHLPLGLLANCLGPNNLLLSLGLNNNISRSNDGNEECWTLLLLSTVVKICFAIILLSNIAVPIINYLCCSFKYFYVALLS